MPSKTTNQLIEALAQSVHKGFEEVHKDLGEIHLDLTGVHKRLDSVETRLTKIENGHIGRIERLEDTMAQVKVKVGIR